MLGDALIRTKSFVTEKVRIQVSFMLFLITLQQSIEHYKNLLDTEAMVNKKMVHEFREREISKEIQPKMRFTASTQLERVIDAINQNRNSVDNSRKQGGQLAPTGLHGQRNQSISEIVMNSMKNNLLASLKNHQTQKLISKSNNADPTNTTHGTNNN